MHDQFIDNELQLARASGTSRRVTLEALERGASARIVSVDWDRLAPEEGARLRALGIDEGACVGMAHRGVFGGRDPLAITIGRMTVAIRRIHAAAMEVEPV